MKFRDGVFPKRNDIFKSDIKKALTDLELTLFIDICGSETIIRASSCRNW